MRTRLTTLCEAERVAHLRDLGRQRKAQERERQREAGRPDVQTLDRALGDAVRSILERGGDAWTKPVTPAALLHIVQQHLHLRSVRARESGRDGPVFQADAVVEAIHDRYLSPPKPARAA